MLDHLALFEAELFGRPNVMDWPDAGIPMNSALWRPVIRHMPTNDVPLTDHAVDLERPTVEGRVEHLEQLKASMSGTSIKSATWSGLRGSTNVRMLVTPRGPKNSSRLVDASPCSRSLTS
jgi:hypothetical protein